MNSEKQSAAWNFSSQGQTQSWSVFVSKFNYLQYLINRFSLQPLQKSMGAREGNLAGLGWHRLLPLKNTVQSCWPSSPETTPVRRSPTNQVDPGVAPRMESMIPRKQETLLVERASICTAKVFQPAGA